MVNRQLRNSVRSTEIEGTMNPRFVAAAFFVLQTLTAAVRAEAADVLPTLHRRPSSAVLSFDESLLFVANRQSGTLSTIELKTGQVSERPAGQQLSALVRRPGSRELLAVDFSASEVIVYEEVDSRLMPRRRIETALWPVAAACSDDGAVCCVTSLWSRRASVISFGTEDETADSAVIDLPFAPRAVTFFDQRHAVVAEAFGGRLAVVDCRRGTLISVRELPIHNIRDLVCSDGSLLLTHQVLNSAARTEAEHIHWGILMQNEVSSLPLAALINPDADLNAARKSTSVGGPGNGAGDPEAIVVLPDRLIVALGGTDELALIDRAGVREVRVATGSRPIDVVVNRAGTRAAVVNELDDSISIVDLTRNEFVKEIGLGPVPEEGLVERGERAFFNSRMSLENWMSCHSCHTDGHTNNQLADTLGDGGYGVAGDAKRVPSLLGVWSTGPWAWNGSQSVLHSQIAASLRTTMHSRDYRLDPDLEAVADSKAADEPGGDVPAELAAYLTTLSRPPSIEAARGSELAPDEVTRGAAVFASNGCATCHDPFTSLTTDGVFDVGLPDRAGQRKFNPPSLGGVSQRDRLLHDGRATSLSEVLGRFSHPNEQRLSDEDRDALISYLKSL
ncbi:c-type cytochrome [bacterium]|nr:c-type cytochrome [bacterium]